MSRCRFLLNALGLACLACSLTVSSPLVFRSGVALAKPMVAPSLEEASGSDWIIEGYYTGYVKPLFEPADGNDGNNAPKVVSFTHSDEFDYFEPPYAQFKVEQILKSPPHETHERMHVGDTVRIPYHFHDLSACVAPPTWKFSPAMMPKKGTRWILFLKAGDSHFGQSVYETYRGNFGRLPDTPENLSKVKEKLPVDSLKPSIPKS